MDLIKKIGELLLYFCESNNKKNKKNEKNENRKIELLIKFDINNYISNLISNNEIYNLFNEYQLINKKIINFDLIFIIKNNKIIKCTLIFLYEKILLELEYNKLPSKLFEKNGIIKFKIYFDNNKIIRKIIYIYQDLIKNKIIDNFIKIINNYSQWRQNNYYIIINSQSNNISINFL